MKGKLFIVCLFFVLVKVGLPLTMQASAWTNAGHSPIHLATSAQRAQLAGTEAGRKGITLVEPADGTQNATAIYDDAEDEDANELIARKFTLIARSYPDFAFQCEPGSSLNRPASAEHFSGIADSKYILLCVIRV